MSVAEDRTGETPAELQPTERTALGRFAFRGRFDRATVYDILDKAMLCHVGYVRDGQPFVVPTSFWRIDDVLYWHGSVESQMLRSVAGGIPICFTVSHVDGLVLSRVMSRHSFNYRSVVALGNATAVTDPAEKMRGMKAFVDRILPGRWGDGVQQPTPTEIERITIVRFDLNEASAKVRSGPPKDNAVLYDRVETWAGHVPIKMSVGRPVADPNLRFDLPVPEYLSNLADRFDGVDLTDTDFRMPDFTSVADRGEARPHETHRVEIQGMAAGFPAADDATILAEALKAGANLPFGCAAGGCGACKVHLRSGEVEMLDYEKAALPDAERDAGMILTCCAVAKSSCVIELPAIDASPSFDALITGRRWLTHDIVGLSLRAKDGAPLAFTPGQFAMLQFGSLPEREYSMATQSGERDLQFHIRVAPDGYVSQHVAKVAQVGDTVRVRGPFGVAVYADQDVPIVAIAGGSGLAPIKSIVDRVLRVHPQNAVRLYIGVRDERDLYLLGHFEALAASHPGFSLHPVLSLPSGTSKRRVGLLADALTADRLDLSGSRVYIAGPPIMVETCKAAALALGAQTDAILADAFLSSDDKMRSRSAERSIPGGKS